MAHFVPFNPAMQRSGYNHQLGRLHASFYEWGNLAGATDFWLPGNIAGQLSATQVGLSPVDFGWTYTSMTSQAPSAADFASKADIGTPASLLTNAASDLFSSPVIFGDFMNMEQAGYYLGEFPTYLMLEMWVSFTTASNNETGTAIGFFEDGGSPIVANDAAAMIASNGTNFLGRSGADSVTSIAVQTTPLGVRFKIAPGTTDKIQMQTRAAATSGWVVSGTFDNQTDEYPVGFGGGVQALGSNRTALHWAHIWYSLSGDFPAV